MPSSANRRRTGVWHRAEAGSLGLLGCCSPPDPVCGFGFVPGIFNFGLHYPWLGRQAMPRDGAATPRPSDQLGFGPTRNGGRNNRYRIAGRKQFFETFQKLLLQDIRLRASQHSLQWDDNGSDQHQFPSTGPRSSSASRSNGTNLLAKTLRLLRKFAAIVSLEKG